ncbi:MAG: TatD family hydrolase [Acidobacteriota bacterium]|nr:TatD family hydrolase [Acidobacteriota bacterium]
MRVVDSHCHIDGQRYEEDRHEVIQRAFDAGVVAMLNIGTGSVAGSSFEDTVALAKKYQTIFAAVGVHPHDASEYDETTENRLKKLCGEPEVIAWGEIGLDFHYDHSPRETQIDVFVRQIEVARELGMPIIIHSRSANEETVGIIRDHCAYEGFRGGIMHCFGGTPEMAVELMDLGFLISFAGNVTFKKADELRNAAAAVPIERLLVETDCPYLTPEPFRGRRNEPARVIDTAKYLAGFYGIEPDELANGTTSNFFRFFDLEMPA